MKSRTLQIISLIIAVLGTIMAFDSTIKTIGIIDPRISQLWPMVYGLSAMTSRIAAIFADFLDDGKLNGSYVAAIALSILLPLSLYGCASRNNPFSEVNAQVSYTDEQGRTVSAGGGVKLRNYAK